jgi:alpha-1,2-mannosyltransferase
MNALFAMLRSGDWLTLERMRLWPIVVLTAWSAGLLFVVVTSDGLNDYLGRPLGSDFSNVYAAGTYVLDGSASAPFDWNAHHARQRTIFGDGTPFYGWHYPPFFLFIAGLLATMPYPLALAVWQAVTLALYLFCIRAILCSSPLPLRGASRGEAARGGGRHDAHENLTIPLPTAARSTAPVRGEVKENIWLLPALAFPAVFVNLGHGHNGFLSAALFGGALVLLERRPVAAGILFGLLSYKPQFGVMIPLVLLATGQWRTLAAAAVTVGLLGLATILVFGPEVWRAFFATAHLTREVVLEAGDAGWHKIQSVFSWVRMWGGNVQLAYAAQGTVSVAIAGALVWLWRSEATFALKVAGLLIGSILATPYNLDYDMMVLAPAMAFLAADGMKRGFVSWEKTTLALLWFAPLFARAVAERAMLPLGVWLMLWVFALLLRRARGDRLRQAALSADAMGNAKH